MIGSFNRTMKELKYGKEYGLVKITATFNRTMKELKWVRGNCYAACVYLLIAP